MAKRKATQANGVDIALLVLSHLRMLYRRTHGRGKNWNAALDACTQVGIPKRITLAAARSYGTLTPRRVA